MDPIHILFGTESNNCADLADRTGSALKKAGYSAAVVDMGDFACDRLSELRTVVVITSTYGNGDPPSNAEALHAFLMKKAPALPALRFAVLALGDKTYDRYCQCGKDFDRRLGELGAQRVLDRKDCDVDYEKPWKAWLEQLLGALSTLERETPSAGSTSTPVIAAEHHEARPGTRKNPVFARVLRSRGLCGAGSTKETVHLELSIAGTGLTYEPGDSLGVWPTNDPALVDAILEAASCDPAAKVNLRGVVHESSRGTGAMTLREALSTHLELAHVDARLLEATGAPPDVVAGGHVVDVLLESERPLTAQQLVDALRPIAPRQYSIASSLRAHQGEVHLELAHVDARLFEATGAPPDVVAGGHVVDVLLESERPLTAQQLVEALRPIAPRQYSIASSLRAHPDQVHLTVDVVRYELRARRRGGVASTLLADRAPEGAVVPVYLHPAPHFRLPADDVPIVMIGPGTGIAPFRAFLEERRARGARGRAWLFFGARNGATDFLYGDELATLREQGVLTRLDSAFSRDQEERVYVQHRMREQARELYGWLSDGAVVYVCGDAKRMAPDVHHALAAILAEQGKTSLDAAQARLESMEEQGLYRRDVY